MITHTSFIPAVQNLSTETGWVETRNALIHFEPMFERLSFLAKEQLSKAGLLSSVQSSNQAELLVQGSVLKIYLQEDKNIAHDEGYELSISGKTAKLKAKTEAGMFYALQTLRQLVYSSEAKIPYITVKDYPAFEWRGFMLDTSRHYYSADFIKKMIDLASFHKLNRFHWHLTDDQGWRLPVKAYEKLTEVGAWRDDPRYSWGAIKGGFYTEEEIKSVVAYARERHVIVVPEIETPGHASAILASYPELGCTGGPYAVETRYGIFKEVLCAGNDAVFSMLEKVFDTVCELFPGPYVHIGGDECPHERWEECPKCQKRIKDEGLENASELQSWITVKVSKMLEERGKIPIGWDEVLDGTEKLGLPKNVVVQSWRGVEGGIKASSLGHKVIMSPLTDGCYLDYKHFDTEEEPGMHKVTTVADSYNYSPIKPEMTKEQRENVLGGQGNIWTEVMYASKIAEYMAFPRLSAISESLWLEEEKKDFLSFAKRLIKHKQRLDRLHVLYYKGQLSAQ